MITDQEFQAIVMLLQRAPMNHAEALAVAAILDKLKPKPADAKP